MSKASKQVAATARTITIAGEQFAIPSPYVAGHVCTEGEAHALNQTLRENARNNLSGKAKEGKLTQADVDAYISSYQFGANGGGFTANPVEFDGSRHCAQEGQG